MSDTKKWFFRAPEASNDRKTKLFELGGLQMIPYDPTMSDCSEGTLSAQTRWPKFCFLQKMGKKLSYLLKQKIAVIQAKSFCTQKNFKNT